MQLNLASWHEALRVRVKSLYATMRILYEQIAAPGHVPRFSDATWWTTRLRRRRSGGPVRWRGRGFHQNL